MRIAPEFMVLGVGVGFVAGRTEHRVPIQEEPCAPEEDGDTGDDAVDDRRVRLRAQLGLTSIGDDENFVIEVGGVVEGAVEGDNIRRERMQSPLCCAKIEKSELSLGFCSADVLTDPGLHLDGLGVNGKVAEVESLKPLLLKVPELNYRHDSWRRQS